MKTGEILKLIIDDRIKDGSLRFGWGDDITEYKFASFIKTGTERTGLGLRFDCVCEYVENGKTRNKYIDITEDQVNEKVKSLRDDKLKTILNE